MGAFQVGGNAFNSFKKTQQSDAAGRVQMIEIDKLVPHEENFYSMNDIELLAEDIERQGLRHNLVVTPLEGDKYKIISGHRRYRAVIFLREQGRYLSALVPCSVGTMKTDDEEMFDLIMMNATGRELTDAERVKQYEHLKRILEARKADGEKFGRIRDKIAETLNVSIGQISKIEHIENNAVEEVKEAINAGSLSISTANEIAKLGAEEQREILESKPAREISYKEAKAKVSGAKEKNVTHVSQNSGEDSNEADSENAAITAAEIDNFLTRQYKLYDVKSNVVSYFSGELSNSKRAEFLKKEKGYSGGIYEDFPEGYYNFIPGKGIELSKNHGRADKILVTLTWSEAARRIGKLIDEGRYMSSAEDSEAPDKAKETAEGETKTPSETTTGEATETDDAGNTESDDTDKADISPSAHDDERHETLSAWLGYAVQSCESLNLSFQQTEDFLYFFKEFFREQSFEEAAKTYKESKYYAQNPQAEQL
ncbi:MAG: ParB/RepB/Spo0J family partition protein [Clostridiales bacterium]|jgi:ParB family chromosome partitioning protein|nr:ParB/RepB/Spo0J family partition protein [Clostridiales bacterium]